MLEYQARRLKRKQDGALFFLKTRHQPRELNQLDYIWPTKNEASRENAAFALGRFMDANVCDIILPEKEQAKALAAYIGALPEDIYLVRVANDYKLSDEQVRQKTFKEAFTRNLVLAFLIRKYDFDAASAANNSSISDSRVLMMFDNEQSFHKGLINIKQFSEAFMGNYSLILESISVNELAETVNFLENEFDIDKVLDIMSDHDNYRMVQSFLNLEYAEDRAKTIRKDMLEFFNYIFTFNLEFARNTPEYEQLSKEIAQIKQALSLDSGKIKTVNNQLDTAQYLLLESI